MTLTEKAKGKSGGTSPGMTMDVHHPRRRWNRLPLAIPVFVRGVDEWGHGFVEFTTAFNINPGGMLLATPKSLPSEGSLNLEIAYAMPNQPPHGVQFARYLRARVVYMDNAEGFQLYGLEFASPLIREHNHVVPHASGGQA
jgi:PilZ domain